MNREQYEDLKMLLCKELEEISEHGEISRSDLEDVMKLTTTIKNIGKIMMMDDEGGYSQGNGDWNASGSYYSRDGRDMYSRNGRDNNERYGTSYGRYSTMRSRAGNESEMVMEKIEQMMNEGRLNMEDRNALRKAMEVLRK